MTRRSIGACALLVAGFLAITVDVLVSGPLTRLDWVTHVFVLEQKSSDWWWWISYVASLAGNQYVLLAPLGALCLLAGAQFRSIRPIVVVVIVMVILVILIPGIKELTGRTPPKTGVDLVFTTFRDLANPRFEEHTEYPSGHAVNAIVIWGMFLELAAATSSSVQRWLPPRRRYQLLVLATAAAGLGMVGLDYHWLTDALAGWLLGAALFIGFLARDPFGPLRRRREDNPAPAGPEAPPGRPRTELESDRQSSLC